MSTGRKKWVWGAFLAVACTGALLFAKIWRENADHRSAKMAIEQTLRYILEGNFTAASKFEYGNEMERLGVSEVEYAKYVRGLLEGYLDPAADIEVVDEPLVLYPPKSEEDRRLQDRIRSGYRTKPPFIVTISRSDGKPPIRFSTFAIKGPNGWIVSAPALVAWFQVQYSEDPKERYRNVLDALKAANLDRICTPSGHWLRQDRLNLFLAGELTEKQIFEEDDSAS